MKFIPLLAVLLLAGLHAGCATSPGHTPKSAEGVPSPIPDRPEQLTFDPLVYVPPDPAAFRVVLSNGPVAYVASDRELPLVTVSILVRTGHYLDPPGQEGLAALTGYLLATGGTKSMTAEELEERLAFLAANFTSGVGNVRGTLSMNLLSKDLNEGLDILREALTQPRFQDDKLALRKEQLLQAMKKRNDDTTGIEGREREFLAYGEAFWGNQYETEQSIGTITRADLQAFHRQRFHPGNFVVAASGDFNRQDMVDKLEALFADWPFQGTSPSPIPTNTTFAAPGVFLVDKDVNQGRVSVMLPGIMRTSPDYFDVVVMNRILGGGGFTSRIVNRVRSDEGLAYAAYSRFPGGTYFPEPFVASFQTKSRTVAYATSIVLEEMARMAESPVTDQELETAKRSMIDTFPRAFASRTAVVTRFAGDEFTGRFHDQPDYYKTYRDRVAAVTTDDVQQAAIRHLASRPAALLVVGNRKDILEENPDHPVRLRDLTEGPVVEVPLRDPMTMRPMTAE
jgi:predicted Zn-dependent peptidase